MAGALQGKRILVVEDEYFIAADLKRAWCGTGAEVIGPAGNLAEAQHLAGTTRLDAAVLDVHLGGTPSFSLAEQLRSDAVPHLFLTGYDSWSIPAGHRTTPRLPKPFAMPVVMEAIARLFGGDHEPPLPFSS